MEDLEEIRDLFFHESSELLQKMESSLLQLENEPPTLEKIDEIFRAIHTIKGSAGVFGYDKIIKFTHIVENLLDHAREGKINFTKEVVSILLDARDHISELVEAAANNRDITEESRSNQKKIEESLANILTTGGFGIQEVDRKTLDYYTNQIPKHIEGEKKIVSNWHISMQFYPDTFRNGLDPASVLRYLEKEGNIVNLITIISEPEDEFKPESCYLRIEMVYDCAKGKQFIEDAFEFVNYDCKIRFLTPNRTIEDLKNYIHASVEIYRTTRILLFLGSLTRNELKEIRKLKIKNVTPKKIEKEAPASLDSNFTDPAPVKFEKNLAEQHSPQNKEIKSLRIDSTKLDKLINLVGELVIAGANISQVASLEKNSALIESSFLLNRLIGEVRENSLKIRMVQIGETFNRFHRTVRDIGQELGKDIRLEITGGESELDKTVVEKISDPLTHLVRNAIDHGIETSEERKKLGKPGLGHLILHAYHETGNIIIEVKDDGKGLDQDRIIQKAIEKEIITPGKNYTKEEIFRLIFKPGFSTAEKVTNLSGRGVGLDVVERNIESLRGSVEVESEKGVGTTFRIRLPLTLAIIDGFLFRVGDNYYVVPLDMVEECIEFSNEMVDPGKRNFFHLRDNLLPFISLRELFVTNGKSSKRKNILVVKHGTKRAGLLVDSLEGETQTVIRPLGKLFSRVKWASGSTILGSGDVAMILDIPALIHKAQETEEKVKQKLDI